MPNGFSLNIYVALQMLTFGNGIQLLANRRREYNSPDVVAFNSNSMHVKHFIVEHQKMRRFHIDCRFLNSKQILILIGLCLYLLVFTTFRDNDLPSLHDPSRPITKFAFMKNHKCASTTIDSIIFRFAEKNNLNLVLPATGNYLSKTTLFDHNSLNETKWKDLNFDIFCLHNRWNRNEVMKILDEETVPTFTIVRDPVDVFVSMFHFQDPFRQFYNVKNIHDMVKKVNNSNNSRSNDSAAVLNQRWMDSIGRNQMAWDMGISPDIYDDQEAMRDEIERLDDEFDLVMVTDRMEESLVLLRHLLHWSTDDVVHLNLNRRKSEKSPKLSLDERHILTQWLAADVQIYQHFSRRLKRRISQFNYKHANSVFHSRDEAVEPMEKELELLKEANKKLYDRCVIQEVGNEKLKGEYQWVNNNVMGFLINEKESGCDTFARSELAYLKLFEKRLYSQLKNANYN